MAVSRSAAKRDAGPRLEQAARTPAQERASLHSSQRALKAGTATRSLRPPAALALQRTAGNRAVTRFFTESRPRRSPHARPVVQRSVMRGDPPGVKIAAGAPAPTTPKLLLSRLETIAEDAGLEPKAITEEAVALFKGAVPKPSPPDPLHRYTVQERAIEVLYELAPAASVQSLNEFKKSCAALVLGKFVNDNRQNEVDEYTAAAEIDSLLDPWAAAAEVSLYTNPARVQNPELRNAAQATVGHNPSHRDTLDVAAEIHLAAENRPALVEPTGDTKSQLIAALEQMPIVQAMYAGTLAKGEGTGLHLKSLEVQDEAKKQAHFDEYSRRFIDNVTEGLSQYSSLVEPTRRPPESRVTTIEVNPDEVKERFLRSPEITSFRADSARKMDRVRLSIMDEAPTVVHEIGHQVEFALPIAEWLDLLQILQARSGRARMVDIYGTGKEIAFAAAMPAFQEIYGGRPASRYAAKIYESGDTEITSMTMEMFSQPAKARIMIHKDPLLSATVLRAIRPAEFRRVVPPPLQALLPRGAV